MKEIDILTMKGNMDKELGDVIIKYNKKGFPPEIGSLVFLMSALNFHMLIYKSDTWSEEEIISTLKSSWMVALIEHRNTLKKMRGTRH